MAGAKVAMLGSATCRSQSPVTRGQGLGRSCSRRRMTRGPRARQRTSWSCRTTASLSKNEVLRSKVSRLTERPASGTRPTTLVWLGGWRVGGILATGQRCCSSEEQSCVHGTLGRWHRHSGLQGGSVGFFLCLCPHYLWEDEFSSGSAPLGPQGSVVLRQAEPRRAVERAG